MAYSQGTGSGGPVGSYQALGNVTYNYAQLEGIWCQAGGAPNAAPIAAAIAMAESGGNTTATNNDGNGSTDRGLWQINSVHGAQSTYDVMGNARAAVAISNNGTNWTPWTTYTSGRYRQFLQMNVAADTSAPINATNAQANATLTSAYPGGPIDPLNYADPWGILKKGLGALSYSPADTANQINGAIASGIQSLISTIFKPIINMIAGVLGITAGGVMVLFGIFLIVKNTETGQEVGQAAGSAAETGMGIWAPETAATTQYIGQEGRVTSVTQRRRPAGRVRIGGRPIQYRPGTVTTSVQRPPTPPKTTPQVLRDESAEYAQIYEQEERRSARQDMRAQARAEIKRKKNPRPKKKASK